MMRTSVFNCASLNEDAQIIHHGHGSLIQWLSGYYGYYDWLLWLQRLL